jgi:1,4-alpha-glucan branching enzyme
LSWFVGYHHAIEKELGGQQDKEDSVDGGINCDAYSIDSKKIVYSMSHDEARDGSQYLSSQFGGRDNWDSRAKCRLIGALQFFIPGIPMLFQGEEFLQDGIFDDDYEHAVNWSYQMDGIGLQMQEMYKEAINKRKAFTALRYGELALTHPKDSNQIIAFIRKDLQNNETILVIVNFGGVNWENYGICTGSESGRWTQIFCNQENNYGGWEWSGNAYSEPSNNGDKIEVNVPKYGVIVMKLCN